MKIKNIRITDFKSLYGDNYFDFEDLTGLIKLSGTIGSGKTSLGEAIVWGLFGTVKYLNNSSLIAWNTKTCEVEINLESKNYNINIIRNIREPLKVYINGKILVGSNKRDTQQILEEEYYDVPKLAILKMCIISFNNFNSLASMTPAETRQFLDDVFNFKVFSEYNDQTTLERKDEQQHLTELNTIYNETESQISRLYDKLNEQQKKLEESIDVDNLIELKNKYIESGKNIKHELEALNSEFKEKDNSTYKELVEYTTLGKHAKEQYNIFKSGICPTCNQKVDSNIIEDYKNTMLKYASLYKEKNKERISLSEEYIPKITDLQNQINDFKTQISEIDTKIKVYENNKKVIDKNYNDLINEYTEKLSSIKSNIDKSNIEIGEWNDMNTLFSKTLRYNILDSLIPNINSNIQYYMNKLEQNYKIEFDQEFKSHIYVDNYYKEISYSNLSTGQKKTLDMVIIFGVLQNIISNVNFNVFFLDELFSNLDSDSRNTMLNLLKDTLSKDRSIFVINHAEMGDDYFNHKIRVKLVNKNITYKKNEVLVRKSEYEKIF